MSALADIMPELTTYGAKQQQQAGGVTPNTTYRPSRQLRPAELGDLIQQSAVSLFATGCLCGLLVIDWPFDWGVYQSEDTDTFPEASRTAFGYYHCILNSIPVTVFTAVSIAWLNLVPHMMKGVIADCSFRGYGNLKETLRWISKLYHAATVIYVVFMVPHYLMFMEFAGFVSVTYDPAMLSDWWTVVAARCVIGILLVLNCRWWMQALGMLTEQLGRFRQAGW